MKKIYLVLLIFTISLLSYGQSPIVVIDRASINDPTTTGNAASISSVGLSRGTGVVFRAGTDHTSIRWFSTSQSAAVANNDYIEWSVSANANFEVEITDVDIQLRRDASGPKNWQLFYSTDGFASNSTAVNSQEAIAANTNINYNLNGFSANSGPSGTITFRLYAWNADNNQGWLRVRRNADWAGFGISLPGIRLHGFINPVSSNSAESNIVSAPSFIPSENIDYRLYSASSGLTVSNSIKIGEFLIQDGGDDLSDADAFSTTLTDLGFEVTGYSNLNALALFDGSTNIGEMSTVTSNTNFSGLNLTAADDDTKSFDVYATFNNTVTDNEQIQLTVNSAIPDANGSTFLLSDAGAAQTSIAGDDNRLEVVATKVFFHLEPSDVNQFETMTPFPVVYATDLNNNLDLDYNGGITVSSTGALDPSSINYNLVSGKGVLNTLKFIEQGSNISLFIIPESGFSPVVSTSFNVLAPVIAIAIQDFDNTAPSWNYSTDVPFFDNGWGTDGYYGVIDLNLASPINQQFFNNNILGENDLYDEEDHGTIGYATVTFEPVDISSYNQVRMQFDWQYSGYTQMNSSIQYEVSYDGINQGLVDIYYGPDGVQADSGRMSLSIPDSVNTVSLMLRIRHDGVNGYSGFDNFKVVSAFDGLVYANNAWIPNPPSNSTGTENAYIKDGIYSVGSDIELNSLFVADGAAVTVSPTKSITLFSDLYTDGIVFLESAPGGYSSLIVEGNSFGNVTYNRHVNIHETVGGNDLISAPVTGETFGTIAANNPNLFSNPSNPTEKLFGPFDKATGTYLTYDTDIPAEAAIVLEPGIGYRAATSDNGSLNFTGIVTTDNVNMPITIEGTVTPVWNLIGNPYPSYLKLSDFLEANNSQFNSTSSGVYGYDGDASDGWQIWNQAYSDLNPTAVMAPGQGFYVSSATSNGIISFNPDMRSIGFTDDFIPGRLSNNPIEYLQLGLNSTAKSYVTEFYFTNNASLGLDPGYDSRIFGGTAPAFSLYSHLVQDNTGDAFGAQSIGYSDYSDVTIPLGVNVTQNQEFTIRIVESSLPASTHVYLEDTVANTVTFLNDGDYTLTSPTNISGVGRFFLRFADASLSTDDLTLNSLHVFATASPKTVFVKGYLTETTALKIIDMQGRLVLNTQLEAGTTNNKVDVSTLSPGIYIVSVINGSVNKTQKVIIR